MLFIKESIDADHFDARTDVRPARNARDRPQTEACAILWHSRALGDRRCSCGRKFLRRLTPRVDSAAGWWNAADAWLSVGISYAGLEALGVPQESLQSFPEAFREGIAGHARQLENMGANNPRNWDLPKSRSWLGIAGSKSD